MRCAVRSGRQVRDPQLPTLQRKSSLRERPLAGFSRDQEGIVHLWLPEC
jgi:hypothetical protein